MIHTELEMTNFESALQQIKVIEETHNSQLLQEERFLKNLQNLINHLPAENIKEAKEKLKKSGIFCSTTNELMFNTLLDLENASILSNTLVEKSTLDFILSHVDSGIGMINDKGDFLLVNNYFSEMLDYTKEELLELNCVDLALPEYREANVKALEEAQKYGKYLNFVKECNTNKDAKIWVNMNIYLLDSGNFLIISNDITVEQELQEDVNRFKDILVDLDVFVNSDKFDKIELRKMLKDLHLTLNA